MTGDEEGPRRRFPAVPLPAAEITAATPAEGPRFVTPSGIPFARALVCGLLQSKFVNEEKNYVAMTVLDDSGTVEAFAFDDPARSTAETLDRWSQILVIGRPMEPREGRVSLRAEIVKPTHFAQEALARLTHARQHGPEIEVPTPTPSEGEVDREVLEKVYEALLSMEEDRLTIEDVERVIREIAPSVPAEEVIKALEDEGMVCTTDEGYVIVIEMLF